MSIDINMAVEVRESDLYNAEWIYVDTPETGHCQNYDLFDMVGGAGHGRVDPKIPPRGLPEDVSPGVQMIAARLGCDFRRPTWFTPNELLGICNDYDAEFGRQPSLWNMVEDAVDQWGQNIRLIVWFDW